MSTPSTRRVPLTQVAGSDRSSTDGVTDGGVSEAWMKDMTAKGEALNDSMLSQQLVWWCLDLAIWHHVPSSARIKHSALPTNAIEATRHQPTG